MKKVQIFAILCVNSLLSLKQQRVSVATVSFCQFCSDRFYSPLTPEPTEPLQKLIWYLRKAVKRQWANAAPDDGDASTHTSVCCSLDQYLETEPEPKSGPALVDCRNSATRDVNQLVCRAHIWCMCTFTVRNKGSSSCFNVFCSSVYFSFYDILDFYSLCLFSVRGGGWG